MRRRSASERPKVIVTVTDSTWQTLAHIADAPREFLIALSRHSPDHVRALSCADAQKLFKTVTPSEIAQIAIRTYLRRTTGPSPPATLGAELARAVINNFPDAYGTALQRDANAARKARPFEKRARRLLVKLTAAENQQFRSFADRTGLGPSDLAGLLIERFAHQFPEFLRNQTQRNKNERKQNKTSTETVQNHNKSSTKTNADL